MNKYEKVIELIRALNIDFKKMEFYLETVPFIVHDNEIRKNFAEMCCDVYYDYSHSYTIKEFVEFAYQIYWTMACELESQNIDFEALEKEIIKELTEGDKND